MGSRDIRVVVEDFRLFIFQDANDLQCRGFPHIICVFFVGKTQDQDFRAAQAFAFLVERIREAGYHIIRHGGIDLTGELNEMSIEVQLPGFPGEIIRIYGDGRVRGQG